MNKSQIELVLLSNDLCPMVFELRAKLVFFNQNVMKSRGKEQFATLPE